jgi:pimeloyl-ACP methyl ester carboxylesterase
MDVLADEGSVDIVGHSMGGLVALHLASSQPDLVTRLILASTPVLREEAPLVRRAAGVVASGSRSDPRSIGLVLATVMTAGPRRIASATQATLRADLGAEAAALRQPTLLVWGSRDRLVSPAIGQRLVELIPDARLVVIEGAGHDAMWEAPEPFNDAVLRFLGSAR